MVIKKEVATMSCQNCDTDLICRTKDYGGTYSPTLQWQNFDGSAHYKTQDGKNFTCNIPETEEDDPAQTKISEPAKTAGDAPPPASTPVTKAEFSLLVNIDEKLNTTLSELERIRDMVTPLFQKMVDDQIGRKN